MGGGGGTPQTKILLIDAIYNLNVAQSGVVWFLRKLLQQRSSLRRVKGRRGGDGGGTVKLFLYHLSFEALNK